MVQTKLVPKKRFKEFQNTNAWELSRLGDVIEKMYNGQTPSRFNGDNWNGDINWLSSGELNRGIVTETVEKITAAGQKNANLRIVPKGIFVMAITGLEAAGTRGNCAVLGIDTTLNQSCMALFPQLNVLDTRFLFQWYRKVGEDYGISYTQGTKQQSYNAELVKTLPITLPEIEEQKKIGQFFTNLDCLITLHQSKLEKTKALKSAYLSEMFPVEGEREPKRRFAGFTQAWEPRKLGEMSKKIEYGLNASATIFDGINKYIRITDIDDDSKLFNQSALTSPDVDLSNTDSYRLKNGDILFARTGASVGKTYHYKESDGKVYYAGFLIRARINEDYDSEFVFQNTLTPKYDNFIKITSQRSGQPGVNAQEYASFELMVPTLEEQQKIGTFFKALDGTIAHHRKKMEKLQSIKKAYLNEMFI
ncbi:restriction endonuclease subunit S [Paenibacillus sp. NRS-1781]|uniref:restriction endonuclease subunit S n=1 Tax=Paenibacillus sp. NRS-1781 TaxID=3233905 RepID=UPI003D2BD9EE